LKNTEVIKYYDNLIDDGNDPVYDSAKINSKYDEMISAILSCNLCEEKFGFEPIPIVFGNSGSKIVQISQAPSKNVHLTGKPFNDATGKKLKYKWYQIEDTEFYNENNFYITALSHCFPGKNNSGGDRLPPKVCSEKWLREEIKLVSNKLYIIIGRKAAEFIFPTLNYKDLIFNNQSLNGKLAVVLPHPSPLNIKWFKDNPDFERKRVQEIRRIVKDVLKNKQ